MTLFARTELTQEVLVVSEAAFLLIKPLLSEADFV